MPSEEGSRGLTPTEIAFLALGLVLGVASGAAIVVVFLSHPSPHEVRVTMARDAVPRRSATLSLDAFHSPAEVARGGPADRRAQDRDFPATNDPASWTGGGDIRTSVLPPARPTATPPVGGPIRTGRQSGGERPVKIEQPATFGAAATSRTDPADSPVSIRIAPEPDPDLGALRASMAVAAEQAGQAGTITAAAILDRAPQAPPVAPGPVAPPEAPDEPAIRPILRGDRRSLLRVVAALAPADRPVERIRWQRHLTTLIEAIVLAAIDEGMLVLPAGHRFWDPFDRDQTREILRALAAHGHKPDGAGGWQDGLAPTGRQMSAALADAGLDPRRIRPWPIEDHLADLVLHATVAADDYFMAAAPDLELEVVRAIVGPKTPGGESTLRDLWAAWDRIRELLLLNARELVRRAALPA